MKLFNIFKKHEESVQEATVGGMEHFEGQVFNMDIEELETLRTMPSL